MSGDASEIMAGDAALEDYLGALLTPLVDVTVVPATPAADEAPRSDGVSSPDDPRPVDNGPAMLECLLIKAAGITLAIRCDEISAVRPWPIDYTVANRHGGGIGGEWAHEGLKVALVDTARVILPAESQAALAPLPGRAHEVLLLADGRWGLVSENASQTRAIAEQQIHWRKQGGRRPWLAGMVSQPQCALLDTAGLVALLEESDGAEQPE